MTLLRRSPVACLVLIALGCSPSVTESASDDIAEATSGDSDASGEAGSSESSSTDPSTTTSGDDPACTPGTLGCDCDSGGCEVGLACVAGVCVEDADTTDTTTDTGNAMHQCGWVPRKNYYFCGGAGVDPSMQHPLECDAFDFPMVNGAPCGPELDFTGCCDLMGDAWYCLDGLIVYEICGA